MGFVPRAGAYMRAVTRAARTLSPGVTQHECPRFSLDVQHITAHTQVDMARLPSWAVGPAAATLRTQPLPRATVPEEAAGLKQQQL